MKVTVINGMDINHMPDGTILTVVERTKILGMELIKVDYTLNGIDMTNYIGEDRLCEMIDRKEQFIVRMTV